eukprot:6590876-Prymnesium_polylepis.1
MSRYEAQSWLQPCRSSAARYGRDRRAAVGVGALRGSAGHTTHRYVYLQPQICLLQPPPAHLTTAFKKVCPTPRPHLSSPVPQATRRAVPCSSL